MILVTKILICPHLVGGGLIITHLHQNLSLGLQIWAEKVLTCHHLGSDKGVTILHHQNREINHQVLVTLILTFLLLVNLVSRP